MFGGNDENEDDDEEVGEEDVDELGEEEMDEEAERLEQFMRMQLHFQNRRNDDDQEGGNGGGHPSHNLSFIPEPGQFDDD